MIVVADPRQPARAVARRPPMPAGQFTAAVWDLQRCVADAAPSGHGMRTLERQCRGSADWNVVIICAHEAGHAAIARLFGLTAEIEVDSAEYGTCNVQRSKSPKVRQLVGLAGFCAGLIAEKGAAAVTATEACREMTGSLSPPDLLWTQDFTEPNVAHALSLVRLRWPVVALLAGWALSDFLDEQAAPTQVPRDNHALQLMAYRQRAVQ